MFIKERCEVAGREMGGWRLIWDFHIWNFLCSKPSSLRQPFVLPLQYASRFLKL